MFGGWENGRGAGGGGRETLRNAQRLRTFLPLLRAGAVVVNSNAAKLCGECSHHLVYPLTSCACCASGLYPCGKEQARRPIDLRPANGFVIILRKAITLVNSCENKRVQKDSIASTCSGT
jgi:hypothetical protein